MEKHGIRAKDLAQQMNISQNAVTNLRSSSMPRIDGERLNSLIIALNRLRKASSEIIGPEDLIVFRVSPSEMHSLGINIAS